MKKREFERNFQLLLPELNGGEPVAAATAEMRQRMLIHLVQHRLPIHPAFITPLADQSWLACCGYMYRRHGFLCTSENQHLVGTGKGSEAWLERQRLAQA